MADYYPLLKRAVSGLADPTPQAREAIYARARKALIGQLSAIDPPVGQEVIDRESAALDEAAARTEREFQPAPAVAAPAPAVAIAPAPPSTPAPPFSPPAARPPTPTPPLATPAPAAAPPAADPPALFPVPEPAPEEPAPPRPSDDLKMRAREPARPLAPAPPAPRGGGRRLMIVGGAVAAVVALVAAVALKLRDGQDDLARLRPVAAPTAETAANGKIVERVGARDEPARAATGTGAAQNAGPTVTQPPIPVAARSALLVEAPDLESKVRTFVGSAIWRLDTSAAGAGQPVGASVHSDIDIPDAKVKMTLDIAKNVDPALPASITISIRFTLLPGGVLPGIQDMAAPQMRREESPNGETLQGYPVKITDTYFFVGLAQGDVASRNADLLRNRGWIDIPVRLTDNRIAKLTIEKGAAGDRIMADALTAWADPAR